MSNPLHRRSRQEQSERVCDSPEVSLKQQRINTARKARAVAHLQENHPPHSHTHLHTHSKTHSNTHSTTQSHTHTTQHKLSPQETLLARNARLALGTDSLDEFLTAQETSLGAASTAAAATSTSTSTSGPVGLPVGCCPYEQHFLQTTLRHKALSAPSLPLVPSKGDFASLSFLFKFSTMLASHPGHFVTPLHIDIVNTPLFEGDRYAGASVEYNATAIFDKFAALHSLVEANAKSNGVTRMSQVELAVLLLFLAKAADSSRYFSHRSAESGGSKELDTAVNCLLAALSDKQRSSRELTMAVACLAFVVQHHSLATRVLTSSNASQLVKLLLSKCVYPNEIAPSTSLQRTESLTSTRSSSSIGSGGSGSLVRQTALPVSWEVSTTRMGLRKLLSLPEVTVHGAVRKELSTFVTKWWSRLQQAALNSGSLVIDSSAPKTSTSTSVPSQYANALRRTASEPTPKLQETTPPQLSPAAKYALDALTDVFSCTNTNPSAPYDPEDNEWCAFSSDDVQCLLKAASTSAKHAGEFAAKLPPGLALVRSAFLSSDIGSPSFLVHFIGSASDPQIAVSSSELALALLKVLRALLVHSTLLEMVKAEAADSSSSCTVTKMYEKLCGACNLFARDVFQHTMRVMGNNEHVLDSQSGDEGGSSQDKAGPFTRASQIAATSRQALGEVSLNVHNTSSTTDATASSTSASSRELLRLIWEPVLLAHLRLIQQCTQFAALTLSVPSAMPANSGDGDVGCLALVAAPATEPAAFEAHRRLVVADWVQGVDSSVPSSTNHMYLGLRHRKPSRQNEPLLRSERVLAEACRFLARSIANSNEESTNANVEGEAAEESTAAASSTLQMLGRFSGALVGVMDVLACLVLDSGSSSSSSPTGLATATASVASSLLLSSLARTFSGYSDSVAYAIETCSNVTQTTLQSLSSALSGSGSMPSSPQQKTCAENEPQEVEPLAHLLELMTVCDRDAPQDSEQSHHSPIGTPSKTPVKSRPVVSPSFLSPRIALLTASSTTPYSAASVDSTNTGNTSLSPLPLVIQKRLAFAAARSKKGTSKEIECDDESDQDSVLEEDVENAQSHEKNTEIVKVEQHVEEDADTSDDESVSESVTVINEDKLVKRLSARLRLAQKESAELQQKSHTKSSPEMKGNNDGGPSAEVQRQLDWSEGEEEGSDTEVSVDIMDTCRANAEPSSPENGTSPMNLDKTVTSTPTQREFVEKDNDGFRMDVQDEAVDLSKTMTMTQADDIAPNAPRGPSAPQSSSKHLYPPFYAGPQGNVSNNRSTPPASTVPVPVTAPTDTNDVSLSSSTTTASRTHEKSSDKRVQREVHGDLSEKIVELNEKIEESHQFYRRHVSSASRSTPTVESKRPTLTTAKSLNFNRSPVSSVNMGGVDLRNEAELKRSQDFTQMRMELVSAKAELEEKSSSLQAVKASLEEVGRSQQHWQWRAEDVQSRAAAEEARAAALQANLEAQLREVADLKLKRVVDAQERDTQASKISSLEALLEEAWGKIKALTRLEEASRSTVKKATAEATHCREEMLEAQATASAASARATASERQVALLTSQLEAERAANSKRAVELQNSEESLGESRVREKATRSQLDGVLAELTEVRGQCRYSAEAVEQLQTSLVALQDEASLLQAQCEAKSNVVQNLKQDVADAMAERDLLVSTHQGELARIEQQLVTQEQANKEELRRRQANVTQLEEEGMVLQNIVQSERAAYAQLETEHRHQVSLGDSLAAELAALQLTAETLRAELHDRTTEANTLKGDLGKHRELISYINKISHEEGDKEMKFAKALAATPK